MRTKELPTGSPSDDWDGVGHPSSRHYCVKRFQGLLSNVTSATLDEVARRLLSAF